MKFEPLGNRILIKQTEAEPITKGGIILPEVAQAAPQIGTVVALWKDSPEVISQVAPKEGDKVLYAAYSGTEICLDDKKYIVLELESILGIINETD
jgi:chaperonin GroES